MGVVYKLREEVVDFIISQRRSNPFVSCRQLAESTSQKFGLNLSKSSVHDVLKESGIITPRGRKPKNKFQIPQAKKQQIQQSLSQIKLLPMPPETVVLAPLDSLVSPQNDTQVSAEYPQAGRIFFKAALWDLGVFSEEVKEADWKYYLTYSKGIRVFLEGDKNFFIELPLPLERCIREVADGLINNAKPFIAYKVSDEELFRACMAAEPGHKIVSISIVDYKDHTIFNIDSIMEHKRDFLLSNRVFVDSNDNNITARVKSLFFSQDIDNNVLIDNIFNLPGFDSVNKTENIVTLLISDSYGNRTTLEQAADRLNKMYIYDEQGRQLKVNIKNA